MQRNISLSDVSCAALPFQSDVELVISSFDLKMQNQNVSFLLSANGHEKNKKVTKAKARLKSSTTDEQAGLFKDFENQVYFIA